MSEIGVIHTEHIKKYYIMGDVEVRALNDITLDVYPGELAAIMGPSGSGKSTLMNILGCLDRPTGGLYKLGGELVSEMSDSQLADVRNRKIGFVFQSFNLLSRSTALENVMLPTLYSKNKANARQRAIDVLEMVGLGARVNHKPKEMSGGQQQRVAIARALINDPEIIMADEPTGNLDSKSGKEIMELLIRLNKEQGKTIILVTHDPKIGKQVPRVISVFDGMLGSEEEQQELKRWTDVNYSRLDGLSGEKAALSDDSAEQESKGSETEEDVRTPEPKEETAAVSMTEAVSAESTPEKGADPVSENTETAVPEAETVTGSAAAENAESQPENRSGSEGPASESEIRYPAAFYRPNPRKMRRRIPVSGNTPADQMPEKAALTEKEEVQPVMPAVQNCKKAEVPEMKAEEKNTAGSPAAAAAAKVSGAGNSSGMPAEKAAAPVMKENVQNKEDPAGAAEKGSAGNADTENKPLPPFQGWLKKLKPKMKE